VLPVGILERELVPNGLERLGGLRSLVEIMKLIELWEKLIELAKPRLDTVWIMNFQSSPIWMKFGYVYL